MNASSSCSGCCQVLPLVSHAVLRTIRAASLSVCHLLCWSRPDPVPPFYSNTVAESGGVLRISAHREHRLGDNRWSCTKRLDFIALWWEEYIQQGLSNFGVLRRGDQWNLPTLQVATKLRKSKLPVNLVAYNANQVYGAGGNIYFSSTPDIISQVLDF